MFDIIEEIENEEKTPIRYTFNKGKSKGTEYNVFFDPCDDIFCDCGNALCIFGETSSKNAQNVFFVSVNVYDRSVDCDFDIKTDIPINPKATKAFQKKLEDDFNENDWLFLFGTYSVFKSAKLFETEPDEIDINFNDYENLADDRKEKIYSFSNIFPYINGFIVRIRGEEYQISDSYEVTQTEVPLVYLLTGKEREYDNNDTDEFQEDEPHLILYDYESKNLVYHSGDLGTSEKVTKALKKEYNDFNDMVEWRHELLLNAYSRFSGKTKLTSEKVGRNEPCPCGSGKKYKKCCGKILA